ncbi:hypothetical protein WICPIJ_001008 [Wickerhamomyces pijperi]|uniref:Uncharacterized protein n=1 Tax=Wickerhamomyces pijperi TaxID=599730 RepID=A0A9P8QF16_WICPI|nr:hypothetical protein WICPIJ_001008 [Wickerhamomyces pijperi]
MMASAPNLPLPGVMAKTRGTVPFGWFKFLTWYGSWSNLETNLARTSANNKDSQSRRSSSFKFNWINGHSFFKAKDNASVLNWFHSLEMSD